MTLRTFGWSFLVTVVVLTGAYWLGGPAALAMVAILSVLEVSLSFDNAVINASVLERMPAFWQKLFLTVGILIAVFGMRLIFPFALVAITASLSPGAAIDLAMNHRDQYQAALEAAHPAIAAFGGMFLLMIFLDFVFEERETRWLKQMEAVLARIGRLNQLSTVLALGGLVVVAETLAPNPTTVLVAGVLGLVTYLAVNGLSEFFEAEGEGDENPADIGGLHGTAARHKSSAVKMVIGKAAFFLFLYLEVLDASFSFDGVVGAFAITSDPFIIAAGLGVGAMYIRSITVFLVRKGTLSEFVYLEHGAHWAIGALAVILLLTVKFHVDEVITGLIGVFFILAAFISSIISNRRARAADKAVVVDDGRALAKV